MRVRVRVHAGLKLAYNIEMQKHSPLYMWRVCLHDGTHGTP